MVKLRIEDTLAQAVQHHQAGRLQNAELLYRQILEQQPDHPDATHLLGVIAHQAKRNDLAENLIRRAVFLKPNFPEAFNNLGNVLQQIGQLDDAIANYAQAISLKPEYADAHNNLGNALKIKGRLDAAIAAYRRAVALRPAYAEAYLSLAAALAANGNLDEAIGTYRHLIESNPDFFKAHNNLGVALKERGQLDEAIDAFRRTIALAPAFPEAHVNLSEALRSARQFEAAIAACRQAISLRPGYAEAHCSLGSALNETGQIEPAITMFRKAIALRPDFPEAYNNLGNALNEQGQLDEAADAYRTAIALRPRYAQAFSNLGNVLNFKGELDQAISAYRAAVELNPTFPAASSNLVFTLQLHPAYDVRAIAQELRKWDRLHGQPLRNSIQAHQNDRDPERRLRIGYMSPDFRDHVVGRNVLPLILHHDRQEFEITCYAQVTRPDEITRRFQQSADRWRNIVGLSDERVAAKIREDGIDILVDLALHLSGNRLMIFARKPAPVQVTFAGYPGSTGLGTIDYRLSDPYLDPVGMDESIYTEKTIRLPDSFWCYDPLDAKDIPVNALPALRSGVITFGCLNNFCKINDGVLELWATVLRQVEGSRLHLLAKPGGHQAHTVQRLAQVGIDASRVTFIPYEPRREYLARYHEIDLALDTFPYNGHTTSLDAFWMGVPVITLVGQSAVSRAGWCQLSNLGIAELAANTREQFLEIAVNLAKDLPRLEKLRSTLRERMERSRLMDAPKFAKGIETAYRRMWRTLCGSSAS